MYFVSAVANLGAIALENAKLYETAQKDYQVVMQEMLEWDSRSWSEAGRHVALLNRILLAAFMAFSRCFRNINCPCQCCDHILI